MEALFLGAFEERGSIWTCTGVLILSGFAFTNYASARKNRGIIVLRNMGPVSERRLPMEQFLMTVFANILAGVMVMFISFYFKK